MTRQLPTILSTLALFGLLAGASNIHGREGPLTNVAPADMIGVVETDTSKCTVKGEEHYQFSMQVALTGTPLPTSSDPTQFGHQGQSNAFFIYDQNCALKGIYPPNRDTMIPWHIADSYMPFEVVITDVFFDVGAPTFTFNYGAGKYKIGANKCICVSNEGVNFPTAGKICGCAFPLNGDGAV